MNKLNLLKLDTTIEGDVQVEYLEQEMKMTAKTNFVLWFNKKFKDIRKISYQFKPQCGDGLAMIFFGSNGSNGIDLFDEKLKLRTGEYPQYHSSDIETYHASYYRRKWADEKELHVANLRQSPGFKMIAQGADPIPTVDKENQTYYNIEIKFSDNTGYFIINEIVLYSFPINGPVNGYIGLRQMEPLVANYKNMEVTYA